MTLPATARLQRPRDMPNANVNDLVATAMAQVGSTEGSPRRSACS